jgi:hypothetical protein
MFHVKQYSFLLAFSGAEGNILKEKRKYRRVFLSLSPKAQLISLLKEGRLRPRHKGRDAARSLGMKGKRN